ncbi:type II toxin-antitoxin system HipA family toxin [Paraburkholderia sp. MMS20-SJTR3]|uniref:Type II toxin-antitoxin system HipA family toxin n=1 Tax=Paraburkholderia sejongensis TaxID=2886946 RepID=A0ABS8JQL2_9BURK|nr:type II toxin-antitoxin system HipA family toxin [Paraburkholderia sp. MMS20-SJTR3]MCC8392181.1 type II toxin-antitoxin system HipA family toxin [Paraburkholderia sp. MMS20-SJTR3]
MSRDGLDVYVGGQLVGTLAQEADRYVFTYLPQAEEANQVSLLMPVRAQSYVWPRLHPFFQMNLPEGAKKEILIRQLGPHADVSDFGLLALTGANTIGRVQVVPRGATPAAAASQTNMADLLASTDSRENLLRLLEAGVTEGVSGVMPKALLQSFDRATTWTDEFILKTGFDDLPGLAINEYLCLEVARHAGLEVPDARLSGDGQVVAVRRFDRMADGRKLAMEDYCALKGLDPVDKYKGTLEILETLTKAYVPREQLKDNARRLFTLLLLNYAIHNQDAHLKNFALVYTGRDDVRLAPVYDVLSGTAYRQYATALPALPLKGKRVWASGALLQTYGGARLGLSKTDMNDAVERVTSAIHRVTPMVSELADQYPDFREVAKRMLDAWASGLNDIKPDSRPGKYQPAPLREQMGMSDGSPDRARKEANPYANPDGAFSHKSR